MPMCPAFPCTHEPYLLAHEPNFMLCGIINLPYINMALTAHPEIIWRYAAIHRLGYWEQQV
jgi:hypothetical protein